MFDCLSRLDTELFEVEDTVKKNVTNSKDINVYVEQQFSENNLTTTKFTLENVPFKLSKPSKLVQEQNITSK